MADINRTFCNKYIHHIHWLVLSFLYKAFVQDKFVEWWPDALRILSRASAADKITFVRAIMKSRTREGTGEIVAVAASGVNDGPILGTADVGLAMVRIFPCCT